MDGWVAEWMSAGCWAVGRGMKKVYGARLMLLDCVRPCASCSCFPAMPALYASDLLLDNV